MAWDSIKVNDFPSDTVNGILHAEDWNDQVAYIKTLAPENHNHDDKYAPITHTHAYAPITHTHVVDDVVSIRDTFAAKDHTHTIYAPIEHVSNFENPHKVTKQQLELSNVDDVKQEPYNINIQQHIANKTNPHETTKQHVGLSNVDDVKQAAYDHTLHSKIGIGTTESNIELVKSGDGLTSDAESFRLTTEDAYFQTSSASGTASMSGDHFTILGNKQSYLTDSQLTVDQIKLGQSTNDRAPILRIKDASDLFIEIDEFGRVEVDAMCVDVLGSSSLTRISGNAVSVRMNDDLNLSYIDTDTVKVQGTIEGVYYESLIKPNLLQSPRIAVFSTINSVNLTTTDGNYLDVGAGINVNGPVNVGNDDYLSLYPDGQINIGNVDNTWSTITSSGINFMGMDVFKVKNVGVVNVANLKSPVIHFNHRTAEDLALSEDSLDVHGTTLYGAIEDGDPGKYHAIIHSKGNQSDFIVDLKEDASMYLVGGNAGILSIGSRVLEGRTIDLIVLHGLEGDSIEILVDGNVVWHEGNFDPSDYAPVNHTHVGYAVYLGALASAPTENLTDGCEYFNTGDSKFYKYTGSAWIALN